MKGKKIALFGEGNMAWFIAEKLKTAGVPIAELFTQRDHSGLSAFINSPSKTVGAVVNSEVVLLAVNDDALTKILNEQRFEDKVVVYFSGALPLSSCAASVTDLVALWPILSISKDNFPTGKQVPVSICARTAKAKQVAIDLATIFSDMIVEHTEEQRLKLHLAATILNNFTNHLIYKVEELCNINQLDRSLLTPLLANTINKLTHSPAYENQTGPAIRRDYTTIERHLSLIKDESLVEIYQIFTNSIIKTYT